MFPYCVIDRKLGTMGRTEKLTNVVAGVLVVVVVVVSAGGSCGEEALNLKYHKMFKLAK